MAAFPYLRRLDLSRTGIGNPALKSCAALARLEWLGVEGTGANRWGRFWLRVARPDLQIARSRIAATRGFRGHVSELGIFAALYIAAIAVATHVPLTGVRLPQWRLGIDKIFHFTAYAGLAFVLSTLAAAMWTGVQGKRWVHLLRYAAILPIAAFYGVIDELTQPAVGRTADTLDWIADVAGAAAGLALFFAVRFGLKRLAGRRPV